MSLFVLKQARKVLHLQNRAYVQGVLKNALSECCWSQGALAQSQVAGTSCVWKLIFWSFLTKTKQDQAPPHAMVKFSPTALNFGYDFVLLVHFFGRPCRPEMIV